MTPRPRLLAAAALALVLLGGCAVQIHHGERGGACPMACNRADPTQPKVSVDAKAGIRLNSEVLAFRTGGGEVKITWTLDAEAARLYRFDRERGIVVEGRLLDEVVELKEGKRLAVALGAQDQIVNCQPADEQATSFTCVNRATSPGIFKYTIRLVTPKGEPALQKDPPILNW